MSDTVKPWWIDEAMTIDAATCSRPKYHDAYVLHSDYQAEVARREDERRRADAFHETLVTTQRSYDALKAERDGLAATVERVKALPRRSLMNSYGDSMPAVALADLDRALALVGESGACSTCNDTKRVLRIYDRPGGPPGNGYVDCPTCVPKQDGAAAPAWDGVERRCHQQQPHADFGEVTPNRYWRRNQPISATKCCANTRKESL